MLQRLSTRLRKEAFITTPLSAVINPFYIIRNGLYQAILQFAPEIKGQVLDFGCGSKPYESLFSNATSYVGVDLEVTGHDHRNSKVDFYYDGKTLPFPDGHFDTVVCFEVFEHIFNLDEILVEIRRVLKPNGNICLSVPFAWDEHEAPYDFARYTSYGITHILKKNGFEAVQVKKTTTYFLAISQLFIAYLSQYVLPKKGLLSRATQLVFIFPTTLCCLAVNLVLPKRYEYFCNSVVLSTRSA